MPRAEYVYPTAGNYQVYALARTDEKIISESEHLTVEIKKPSSRLPYILIIAVLLVAAAAYTFKRFRRFKAVAKVIPKADMGLQEIITSSPAALQYELRLKPVLDNGEQAISSESPIILSEKGGN